MIKDEAIIAKMINNEKVRQNKEGCEQVNRVFKVMGVQQGPGRTVGLNSEPIYVKLDNAKKDLVGSLLSSGSHLFYVDDVSEEGGFSKLYLFANSDNDHVKRSNFPKNLTELC